MQIQRYWFNDQQTINCWKFPTEWTWDMFHREMQAMQAEMRARQSQRIDVIAVLSENGRIPQNAILHVRRASLAMPDNWGITVIVNPPKTLDTLFNIGRRLNADLAHKYHMSPNIESALQYIKANRKYKTSTPD